MFEFFLNSKKIYKIKIQIFFAKIEIFIIALLLKLAVLKLNL